MSSTAGSKASESWIDWIAGADGQDCMSVNRAETSKHKKKGCIDFNK